MARFSISFIYLYFSISISIYLSVCPARTELEDSSFFIAATQNTHSTGKHEHEHEITSDLMPQQAPQGRASQCCVVARSSLRKTRTRGF